MRKFQFLYLSRADVEKVNLEMPDIIELLEKAFIEKGNGKTEIPPKPGIHPQPNALINAMLAYIPGMQAAGIKWVSAFPGNAAQGLPYVSGLMILNDVKSGLPYALMDATWITAYRTAAATTLSARYLARPESSTAGILACGVQGRSNLEALKVLFPIRKVYAYDLNPQTKLTYAAEMSQKLDIEVVPVEDPHQAVENSDLVVTSGPILRDPQPSIPAGWLKPGAFASAVDYDSFWYADAVKETDKFCTDDIPQWLFYKEKGYFKDLETPYADLGELAAGLKPGRQSPEERILTMNLGLAIDDVALGPEIYRRARQMEIGTWLEL